MGNACFSNHKINRVEDEEEEEYPPLDDDHHCGAIKVNGKLVNYVPPDGYLP
jgi:hypothetical protein